MALFEQLILALAKALKECLAVNGPDPAALDVIVAAVEHLAHLGGLFQIAGEGVLYEIVGGAAAL